MLSQRPPSTAATAAVGAADCGPPPSGGNISSSSISSSSIKPDLLQPFLPASDPSYRNVGPVGQGDFVVRRTGSPTPEELTNENILKIVSIQCSDLEVNTLVWKCLGYRFKEQEGGGDEIEEGYNRWSADECFPNWQEKFPDPPDLIGMQRIYSPEVDKPSLKANQSLVRSIPADNKQSLKTHLKPLGWKGYQYAELTPNKTRRAQCANWLIFYREELFGYTVEELRKRRKRKNEAEAKQGLKNEGEWKPPVKEVF
jgi:Domain of unknown function (DUF1823)